MTYDLPDNVKQTMAGSLGEGDAVQLPFSAAYFWVVNGNPQLVEGVQRFGGWATSAPEFEEHMAAQGAAIPAALTKLTMMGEESSYEAYTARAIAVAPIALRRRNASEDPDKFRAHVQVLCIAITGGQERASLGAVVLTAKGYQASNITKAFKAFEQASAEARRTHAGGLDAKLFFTPIGTFGDEPVFESVGKVQKSKITPITAKLPQSVTDEYLRGVYVGRENAERMAEMKQQAQEWVADWSSKKKAAPANDPFPEYADAPPVDEIPF